MGTVVERERSSPGRFRSFFRRLASTSARDIVGTVHLQPVSDGTDRTTSDIFAQAQNPRLNNCTFVTNLGPVSYRIVQNTLDSERSDGHAARQRTVDASGHAGTVDAVSSTVEGIHDGDDGDAEMTSQEIYVEHMTRKKRGYPLWIPSPNISLPMHKRRVGVMVGDVGVITPEGGFDFLFNIFYEAGEELNQGMVLPPRFHRLESAPLDFQEFKVNSAKSYIAASDGAISRMPNEDISKLSLKISASEGAVLVFPEDVHQRTHANRSTMEKFIALHLEDWYRFVKSSLRPDIDNGDIRVVYSCHKSPGFGIAVKDNQSHNTELTFAKLDRRGNPHWGEEYTWNYVGAAEVKTGPSLKETFELGLPTSLPPSNQCFFISTINTRLGSSVWKSVEEEGLSIIHGPPSRFGPVRSDSSEERAIRDQVETSGTTQSGTFPSKKDIAHPANLINTILLDMVPTAYVSVVADDHWTKAVVNSSLQRPDMFQFIHDVYDDAFVHLDQGKLYLSNNREHIRANTLEHDAKHLYNHNARDTEQKSKCIPCLLEQHSALQEILIPDALQQLEDLANQILFGATKSGAGLGTSPSLIDSTIIANNEVTLAVIGNLLAVLATVIADAMSSSGNTRNGFHHPATSNRFHEHFAFQSSDVASFTSDQSERQGDLYRLMHETHHMSASYVIIQTAIADLQAEPICPAFQVPVPSGNNGSCMPDWRKVLHGPHNGLLKSESLSSNERSGNPQTSQASSASSRPSARVNSGPDSFHWATSNQLILNTAKRWKGFQRLVTEHRHMVLFREVARELLASNTPFVPQPMYQQRITPKPSTIKNDRSWLDASLLNEPIYFVTRDHHNSDTLSLGVQIQDVRRAKRAKGNTLHGKLYNHDLIVFEGNHRLVLHVEWPGYMPWDRDIIAEDLTLAMLVGHVAEALTQLVLELQAQPFDTNLCGPDEDPTYWRFGEALSDIKRNDIILLSLHNVAPNMWQPQLALRQAYVHRRQQQKGKNIT